VKAAARMLPISQVFGIAWSPFITNDLGQFNEGEYNAAMPRPSSTSKSRALLMETPIQFVQGIGPRRSEQLVALGIHTVGDLVGIPPFRYEDRTQFRELASLREEDWIVTQGEICSISGFNTRRKGMSVVELLVRDGTGSVRLKFFNQPYLSHVYRAGLRLVLYGQVKRDSYAHGALCLMNPECEILEDEKGPSIHSGRIVPIYRKIADLRGRTLRQIMHSVVSGLPVDMADPLPDYLRKQLQLLPRAKALARIHFPEICENSAEQRAGAMEALNQGLSPAHKRMIFEELFELQVGIRMVRANRVRQTKERTVRIGDNVRQAIKRILPFHPTDAQKRVLKEIADDMCWVPARHLSPLRLQSLRWKMVIKWRSWRRPKYWPNNITSIFAVCWLQADIESA
jgi:ATP-dependent DNA helicase RecG